MKTHKKRARITTMATVLAVVVAAAVSFTVWFAYHSAQLADASLKSANKVSGDMPKLPQITDFDSCKKAGGSKLLQTYPAQCVTQSGKTFTEALKYLTIKEWGVEIPLTSTVSDATYAVKAGAPDSVYLSLNSLSSTACRANDVSMGAIRRFTYADADPLSGKTLRSENPTAVKIGNYYFYYEQPQDGCGDTIGVVKDSNIKAAFSVAVSHIQATSTLQ